MELRIAKDSVDDPLLFPPTCHDVFIFPIVDFWSIRYQPIFSHFPETQREEAVVGWQEAMVRAIVRGIEPIVGAQAYPDSNPDDEQEPQPNQA
ncbi:hypothetical protein CDD83_10781 [Cordyceps sp. RAO-2017]|nr:hypothetical protein CDD83_10781 [Cordyceps sp. RAO-2017]